jgi:hypothetical protein
MLDLGNSGSEIDRIMKIFLRRGPWTRAEYLLKNLLVAPSHASSRRRGVIREV